MTKIIVLLVKASCQLSILSVLLKSVFSTFGEVVPDFVIVILRLNILNNAIVLL